MPDCLQMVLQLDRKPLSVHGLPALFVRMIGERLGAVSSAALIGDATGMTTRAPVFDCRNLM